MAQKPFLWQLLTLSRLLDSPFALYAVQPITDRLAATTPCAERRLSILPICVQVSATVSYWNTWCRKHQHHPVEKSPPQRNLWCSSPARHHIPHFQWQLPFYPVEQLWDNLCSWGRWLWCWASVWPIAVVGGKHFLKLNSKLLIWRISTYHNTIFMRPSFRATMGRGNSGLRMWLFSGGMFPLQQR